MKRSIMPIYIYRGVETLQATNGFYIFFIYLLSISTFLHIQCVCKWYRQIVHMIFLFSCNIFFLCEYLECCFWQIVYIFIILLCCVSFFFFIRQVLLMKALSMFIYHFDVIYIFDSVWLTYFHKLTAGFKQK